VKNNESRIAELERRVAEIKAGKVSGREVVACLLGVVTASCALGGMLYWTFPAMDPQLIPVVASSIALLFALAWFSFKATKLQRETRKQEERFKEIMKDKCEPSRAGNGATRRT
jgi:hypothetical protein